MQNSSSIVDPFFAVADSLQNFSRIPSSHIDFGNRFGCDVVQSLVRVQLLAPNQMELQSG